LVRTAAVSALAADLLAPVAPDVLLTVGTGALSRYLVEGHLAVRRYRSVLIWGRDPDKAAAVARDLGARGWPVAVAADLALTALTESGDLSEPLARGVIAKDDVCLLGELIAAKAASRTLRAAAVAVAQGAGNGKASTLSV
jgi:ornithine cyclodeaminase